MSALLLLFVACGGTPEPAPPPAAPPAEKPAPAGKAEAKAPAAQRVVTDVKSGDADASAPCPDCNVVWLTMDTTRADRMGFHGNTSGLTPNLDKLAKRGLSFQDAWSQAPETTLSVASFFSGRYRHNNGMDYYLAEKDAVHPISAELTTVAEVLHGRGYHTVAMYANPILWEKSNLGVDQGFDVWRGASDADMATLGPKLWETHHKQAPKLFLYAQFFGPHTDNTKLDGFETRRGHFDSKLGTIDEKLLAAVRAKTLLLTPGDVDYIRAMYDDAVWEMDQRIGALIDGIQATPEAAHTIWIITADHGESLWEPADPPWLGHEAQLHEEMLRVPIVVVSPGVTPGKVDTQRIAEVIDLAPTLMGLLGVPVDPAWKWDGEALAGPTAQPGGPAISDRGTWNERQVSARTRETSLIRDVVPKTETCYDLKKDPHQAAKLDPTDARCAALRTTIDHYLDTAHPPARDASAPTGTDEKTQEMLKKLGYTQ